MNFKIFLKLTALLVTFNISYYNISLLKELTNLNIPYLQKSKTK